MSALYALPPDLLLDPLKSHALRELEGGEVVLNNHIIGRL